jgi:RNA polymerase-binding transcription factor DksA
LTAHLTEPQREVLERLLRAQIAALRQVVAPAREGLPQRIVLRDALRRLLGPDYGTCSGCDAEIPYERLVAEPQAERCLACETVHERHLAL